jgi:hypothetical protein
MRRAALFSVLYRLFYVCLVSVIIIVSLEIILRIFDRFDILNLNSRKEWLHLGGKEKIVLVCYPSNPDGYFNVILRDGAVRMRYGINDNSWKKSPFCIEEKYNSLDYREREVSPRSDKPRIIFLGDSFSLGEGVKIEDRFSEVLGNKMAGRFEIYNFSTCGAGISEVYEKQFRDALAYSAGAVIYCYNLGDPVLSGEISGRQKYINDLMNIRYYNSSLNKFFNNKKGGGFILNSKIIFVLRRLMIDNLITMETIAWYKDMYGADNPGWNGTKEMLLEMRDECRKRGVYFAIAVLPVFYDFNRYPFTGLHQKVAGFCRQNGIEVLDMLPFFRSLDYRKYIVHPLDYHPNNRAHALMAEKLGDFISEKMDRPRAN